MTYDGMEAVMQLGQGDMRRVLNLLQSTHMAYHKVRSECCTSTKSGLIQSPTFVFCGDNLPWAPCENLRDHVNGAPALQQLET